MGSGPLLLLRAGVSVEATGAVHPARVWPETSDAKEEEENRYDTPQEIHVHRPWSPIGALPFRETDAVAFHKRLLVRDRADVYNPAD